MRTPLAGLLVMLLAGCIAPPSHRANYPVLPWNQHEADESFRGRVPWPQTSIAWPRRMVEENWLANGIRILLDQRHDLPLVAVAIVVRRGSGDAPAGVAVLASRLGPASDGDRLEQEIRRALDQTTWQMGVSYDAIEIHSRMPVGLVFGVFPVMAYVIQMPFISETAFLRERQQLVKTLSEDMGRNADEIDHIQGRLLFPPQHPYRTTPLGGQSELEALRSEDVKRFVAEQVTPDQIAVVAVGDLSLAQLSVLVQATFNKHRPPARPRAPAPVAPVQPASSAPITIIDRPALARSLLTISAIGPAISDADFDAMRLMNLLLGGMASSRLNSRLREDLGYTYAVGARLEARRGPAPILLGSSVAKDKTADALREGIAQIHRMRTELVSDEELELAKSRYLSFELASRDSFDASLHELVHIATHGLPADESSLRMVRVRAVSKEDILRVAAKYLSPARVRILVEGNASAIRSQVESLGLGTPDVIASKRHW